MSNYESIGAQMIGRIAMSAEDAALVEKYAALCYTWCEIGTLWGGSAILAALANPELQVTCIDPMQGYYGEKDKWVGMGELPTVSKFRANLELFEVSNRVLLIQANSVPFPCVDHFDGFLIDGDHSPEVVAEDIVNAQKHASKYILIHDTNDGNIQAVIEREIAWGMWRDVEASPRMRVFGYARKL